MWTRAELLDRKKEVPSERELRRLICLALRYVRRGRTNFVIRDYIHDKNFASYRLATFVTIRLEKPGYKERNRRS
jgi:hypothetical protein